MKNAQFWAGRTIRETFDSHWRLDEKTGCHEWMRSIAAGGYGQLNVGGKPQGAHRFSWERVHGPVLDGLHVLHRCDNRRCVNVKHMFLGTNDDNIRDTHAKGRNRGPGSRLSTSPLRCRRNRASVAMSFDSHWKVDVATGCWLWQLALNEDGYGKVLVGSRKIGAHRFSYERANGPIASGLVVRHNCDNPSCVNPAHLEAGTQRDNVADMVAKGRQRGATGERNTRAKLSWSQVCEIRSLAVEGLRRKDIAARYVISELQVRNIVRGRAWRIREVA